MSENVPYSYSEQVGLLLSEIADLILNGKEDWATLERLRDALHPSFSNNRVIGIEPPGETSITKQSVEETLRSIYGEQIREDLSSAKAMRAMLDLPRVQPVAPTNPPLGSIWTDTNITDSATFTSGGQWSYNIKRRDGKSGPKGNK